MKILITNDDGIFSEGLAILTKWATKLGEVYVVAPSQQQSGKSHAITIHSPFEISKVTLGLGEKEAYAVDSTPVDCVRFATLGLGIQFDLIFSGINKGYNLGEDILYSGTVGALFEASLAPYKRRCLFRRVHFFSTCKGQPGQNLRLFCAQRLV